MSCRLLGALQSIQNVPSVAYDSGLMPYIDTESHCFAHSLRINIFYSNCTVRRFTFWISLSPAESLCILTGLKELIYIYCYYTKGERNDADDQACRSPTAKVLQKGRGQTSASLFLCINPFCLSIITINNKYLRTCKYPR